MPVDRERWFGDLNLSNFVNTYYQYRDLESLDGCRRVLIVGPGQGLDTVVLRWRGYEVTTLDVDETFRPDLVGSVHSMGAFHDRQFDVVIASHVLEHLPLSYLNASLEEIARVGRFALIYLPVAGRHGLVRFVAGVRNLEANVTWDIFNYLLKPDGQTAALCARQHCWEVGYRGFRRRDIRGRLRQHFKIISDYRNYDWLPSYNFVLQSRHAAALSAHAE
jgi:SAM-dependent methyltransferase